MATNTRCVLASFSLGLALIGCPSVNAEPDLSHPGRVMEMDINRPLDVDVKAWADSRQSGREGDCPLFGKSPLDSTRSNPTDGQFILKVDAGKPTYTTVYCANGYFPRADRDLQNRDDGSPIIPTPVNMFSRNSTPQEYDNAIRRQTVALLNDLTYLENINPERFDNVLRQLGKEVGGKENYREQVLFKVRDIVSEWQK